MKYRNNTHVNPYNPSLKLSELTGLVFMHSTEGKYTSTDGRFEITRMPNYSTDRHSQRWQFVDNQTGAARVFGSAAKAKQFARDTVKSEQSL